jgi:Xaa-Pro aminopeptidase
MDVHDTPSVSKSIPLLPGMVITIEPALYFPRNKELRHLKVQDELKGIGVRIEDDILMTEKILQRNDGKAVKELSCEVLSASCPKTISDLESLPL